VLLNGTAEGPHMVRHLLQCSAHSKMLDTHCDFLPVSTTLIPFILGHLHSSADSLTRSPTGTGDTVTPVTLTQGRCSDPK
jgi:hypothetical protein